MPKKPLFSNAAAIYFNVVNRLSVSCKKGLFGKGELDCKNFPCLVASFGFEGDKDAPVSYVDGTYCLRDRGNTFVTFGIGKADGKINWYNKEGYLPCFVSEFDQNGVSYKIENFADRLEFDGNAFVVAYSRLTVTNKTDKQITLPRVSGLLIQLNKQEKTLAPSCTAVLDFAVGADRFGGKYPYPAPEVIAAAGGFDEHYKKMKSYWLKRLEPLCEITKLPDPVLIDAYKAGYIYTMIVKDGTSLHVGENGYDRVFDHDVLGILSALLTMGDFKHIKEYATHILENVQYPDARWKYSWFFAQYLMKTGDTDYIMEQFDEIRSNAHSIEESRENSGTGIMKRTNAIDSHGYWTIDNQSALTGLCCYEYICNRIGNESEARWAKEQYDSLLDISNRTLAETISDKGIDYLPISMTETNEEGPRSDPRDANWASMFLFGRWSWDGYLFCARQEGVMLDLIDRTYAHGFERRKGLTDTVYNFGGYPHGYFSSAYNAGYGSAALRGDKYRDCAIKAYQFMINNSQSGPFSWWEGVGYPDEKSPWSIAHAASGGGSCQHIWGQSTATKALFDSLICQRSNGDLIIGRGIPEEWLYEGAVIEVKKYPLANGKRIDFTLTVTKTHVEIRLRGDMPEGKIIPDFPGAATHEIHILTMAEGK